jgi:hypothetical protein
MLWWGCYFEVIVTKTQNTDLLMYQLNLELGILYTQMLVESLIKQSITNYALLVRLLGNGFDCTLDDIVIDCPTFPKHVSVKIKVNNVEGFIYVYGKLKD